MRHIPEEELHAYLDQALSRSQCVEIERHLTRCTRCRLMREDIAVVRDRTTDLLARLGPSWFLSPPFEQIRLQSHLRQRRRRLLTASLVAAGLAVAALMQTRPDLPASRQAARAPSAAATLNYAARPSTQVAGAAEWRPPEASTPPRSIRPVNGSIVPQPPPAPAEPTAALPPDDSAGIPGPAATATLTAVAFESPSDGSALGAIALGDMGQIEAQPVDLVSMPPGLWLTVSSEDERIATPAEAARIPGLPVLRVRVQPGERGSEVVAVDQLLESGEVVRTLSGPPDQVHSALAGDRAFRDPSDPSRLTVTIRQGDRMVVVTGPSEILGTLLSSSGLRRRY